jgi:hypothetical protein
MKQRKGSKLVPSTPNYRSNWERIFGGKKEEAQEGGTTPTGAEESSPAQAQAMVSDVKKDAG